MSSSATQVVYRTASQQARPRLATSARAHTTTSSAAFSTRPPHSASNVKSPLSTHSGLNTSSSSSSPFAGMPSPAVSRLDIGIHRSAGVPASRSITSAPVPLSDQHIAAQSTADTALTGVEAAKQLAAWTAVDRHVKPEHKIIGIGSGSTVPYVVERIIAQGVEVNSDRVFIPTGFQSKELIVKGGLLLGDVDQYPSIDVTIDGADEVDAQLNCIKGGGACHLREKVLAEAADTFVLVADSRKKSQTLGTNWKQGVPIEVAPFAYAKLLQNLHRFGSPKATLRMAKSKAGPVVTDNGNFVIDAPFDEQYMKHPFELLSRIKMLTGVVEVGLFCHMAKAAYFGEEDGTVTMRQADGRVEKIDTPLGTPMPSDSKRLGYGNSSANGSSSNLNLLGVNAALAAGSPSTTGGPSASHGHAHPQPKTDSSSIAAPAASRLASAMPTTSERKLATVEELPSPPPER